MKKMQMTFGRERFVISQRADGLYNMVITDRYPDGDDVFKYEGLSFLEAGNVAHEMADNNDIGSKVNQRMCEVFGATFDEVEEEMTRHDRVKNELKNQLENRTTQFLDLTMKADGETVTLSEELNGRFYVWFSLIGHGDYAKDIDEVVDWLIAYPAKAKEIQAEEDRYFNEEEPKLRAYFKEHIEGKSWDEIDDDCWGWYSDWHKDVYGYRPHGIVCGEYINPHA